MGCADFDSCLYCGGLFCLFRLKKNYYYNFFFLFHSPLIEVMLTDRKRQQLHDDMLQYFETVGFDTVASVFKEAMQNGPVKQALDTPALERKYANILRQAKLLTAAEAMNKQLSQQIEELQDPSTVKRTVAKDFLPSRLLHTLEGHGNKKEITSLCFHPAQPLCFSAAEDGKIKTWDYESGEGIGTLLGHEGAVKCISVDNAGERLASSSECVYYLFVFGRVCRRYNEITKQTNSDTDIRVFDISSETCIRRLQGHEHTVSHVEWVRPDCHLLVSASRDGSARLWDVANSCVTKIFRAAEGDWLRCARVDKGIVIVAGDDKIIRSWDVSGGYVINFFFKYYFFFFGMKN